MDVWCKKAGSSTLKKVMMYTFNKGKTNLQIILTDENYDPLVTIGDVVYYSIYPMSGTSLKGTVFWEYFYYSDDVTDSAYKQYQDGNSLTTEPKTEYAYRLRDSYDVDCFYIDKEIEISIDGKTVAFDAKPFIDENDRTQVPVHAVSEMLDSDVDWAQDTQTVTITNGEKVITIVIGEDLLMLNNEKVQMDTKAIIKNERTFIPVRFAAKALGLIVTWIE